MNVVGVWVGAVLIGSLVACSSSSSPEETATKDAGHADSGGSSSGGSGGGGAPGPAMGDPKTCAGSLGPCSACCENAVQGGAEFFRLSQTACVCSGAGSCADSCSALECSELRPRSQACEQCMTPLLDGKCNDQAMQACSADPTCKTYQSCLAQCP